MGVVQTWSVRSEVCRCCYQLSGEGMFYVDECYKIEYDGFLFYDQDSSAYCQLQASMSVKICRLDKYYWLVFDPAIANPIII